MADLPMFPLGSVLFPHMPLQLRVFEHRYLVMLSEIITNDPPEFGVVLIERGQEVGGGENRFMHGTVAQVKQVEESDGFFALVAEGERRVEVAEWAEDDPYPMASIRELPELIWDDDLLSLRVEAERAVRSSLAVASEYSQQQWAPTVEVSDDPVAGAWQLAAIAPLAALDQVSLLRAATMEQLLERLAGLAGEAEDTFRALA
jgi:Lon protease-like protein